MDRTAVIRRRPGSWGRHALVALAVVGVLAGCGGASSGGTGASSAPDAAFCQQAREGLTQLPLSDLSKLSDATPEQLKEMLATAKATYARMAEVAGPELRSAVDAIRQGLEKLDTTLADAGYDWRRVDVGAITGLFTPEFDAAVRQMSDHVKNNCGLDIATSAP